VYRSTDTGENWYEANIGLPQDDRNVLSIATCDDAVFAGTTKSLYKSTDNGNSWMNIGRMDVSSVEVDGATVWAVSKENSFAGRTTNDGEDWTISYIGSAGAAIGAEYLYRIPSNGYLFAAGALSDKGAIYRSTNSGGAWSQVYHDGSSFGTGSKVYTVGSDIVSYDNYVYAGGGILMDEQDWENLFHSTDDGASWAVSGFSPVGSGCQSVADHLAIESETRYAILAMNPNVTSTVYAARSGGLWRSTNGGADWNHMRGGNDIRVIVNPCYPNSDDHVFILTKGYQGYFPDSIIYSWGGGTGGTNLAAGLTERINDIRTSANAGFVYAGTEKGVYKLDIEPRAPQDLEISTSGAMNHPKLDWTVNPEVDVNPDGKYRIERRIKQDWQSQWGNWVQIDSVGGSVAEYIDTDLLGGGGGNDYAQYRIRAVDEAMHPSEYSDIVSITFCHECTSITGIEAEGDLPESFELSQNYPNPFNPRTTFKYALPEDAHVVLRLYDVLGQEVATLVNEMQSAGYRSVDFNASSLGSGVYYYKLTAGTFTAVRKMVVLQ
jgi:photosystem II stability/assembly factor-like uncharacterized protein